jgi:hypothetical protein
MASQVETYSPREFLAKLREDDFKSTFHITGMVKSFDEEDDSRILFAVGTDCANWIEIPVSMIEKIELVEVAACKDHTHPLVNLYFADPTTEEAQLFASLARALHRPVRTSPISGSRRSARGGIPYSSRATHGSICAECFEYIMMTAEDPTQGFFDAVRVCSPLCPG